MRDCQTYRIVILLVTVVRHDTEDTITDVVTLSVTTSVIAGLCIMSNHTVFLRDYINLFFNL